MRATTLHETEKEEQDESGSILMEEISGEEEDQAARLRKIEDECEELRLLMVGSACAEEIVFTKGVPQQEWGFDDPDGMEGLEDDEEQGRRNEQGE